MKTATKLPDARPAGAIHREVPAPIVERLEGLLRRIRRIILLRGLLGATAVAVGVLLLMMAVDASLSIESTPARVALSLSGLGLVAAAVLWFVVRPLSRPLSLTTVARMVEERHPELHERISSAFELLTVPESGRGSRGSEQLIAALAAAATLDVGAVDPRREVGTRSVRPYLAAAGVLFSTLLLLFVCWPRQTSQLLLRIFKPRENLATVQALSLEVEPNEDKVVALGAPLTVSVRSSGAPLGSPQLRHIDSTGLETRHLMQPVAGGNGGAYAYQYDSVLESFEFRVQDGSAVTRLYRITAVPKPTIQSLRIRYEYPSYTGLQSDEQADAARPIAAPLGTRVSITATSNRPVARPTLQLRDDVLKSTVGENPSQYTWSFMLSETTPPKGTLLLEDDHGLKSDPMALEIHVLADRAPLVKITDPAQSTIKLKPADRLRLHYEVAEDFGASRTELMLAVDDKAVEPIMLALPTTATPAAAYLSVEGRRWQGSAPLDLGRLNLASARKVTVRVRIADNRPASLGGPQPGLSAPLVITLDQSAADYNAQKIEEQTRQFQAEVSDILKDVQAAEPMAQSVAAKVGQEGEPSDATRKEIDTIRTRTNEAATRLLAVAERYRGTLLDPLTPKLADVANKPLAGAATALDQTELSDKPAERAAQGQAVQANLAAAAAQLKALLGDSSKQKDALGELARLDAIKEKQEKIIQGLKADAAAAENKPSPNAPGAEPKPPQGDAHDEAWKPRQAEVARELGEQVNRNRGDILHQLASDEHQAGTLAAEARAKAQAQRFVKEALERLQDPNADREVVKAALFRRLAQLESELSGETKQAQQQLDAKDPAEAKLGEASQRIAAAAAALSQQDIHNGAQQAREAGEALKAAESQPAAPKDQEKNPQAKGGDKPPQGQPPKPGDAAQTGQQAQQGQRPDQGQPPHSNQQSQSGQPKQGDSPPSQPSEKGQAPKPGDSSQQTQQPQPGKQAQGKPQPGKPQQGEPKQGGPQSPQHQQPQPGQQAKQGDKPQPGQQSQQGQPSAGDQQRAADKAAAKIAQLGKRQAEIVKQIDAVSKGQLEPVLAQLQSKLANDAKALEGEVAGLQQRQQQLGNQSVEQPGQQAADGLKEAQQQAGEAKQQLTPLDKHPSGENQSGTGEPQPGKGENQSGSGQQSPGKGEDQSGKGQPKPSDGENPSGKGQQQPGDGHQQPGNAENQPGQGQPQPGSGKQEPGKGPQPGMGENQLGKGENLPSNGQPQPGKSENQPGQGQPPSGSGKPESGSGQQPSGKGQQQPGEAQNQSGKGQPQPGSGPQQSGKSENQPGPGQPPSGAGKQEPGSGQPQPGNGETQSGKGQNQPGQGQKPEAGQGQPGQHQPGQGNASQGQGSQPQGSQGQPNGGAPAQSPQDKSAIAAAVGPQQRAADAFDKAAGGLDALQHGLAGQLQAQANGGQPGAAQPATPAAAAASAPATPASPLSDAFNNASDASHAASAAAALPLAENAGSALKSSVSQAQAAAGVGSIAAAAPVGANASSAAQGQGKGQEQQGQGKTAGQGGQPSGPPKVFSGTTGNRSGAGQGVAVAGVGDTRISAKDHEWIILQGRIRGNVTEAAGSETPPDYRDMVNRYFKTLSKHGADKPEEGGN